MKINFHLNFWGLDYLKFLSSWDQLRPEKKLLGDDDRIWFRNDTFLMLHKEDHDREVSIWIGPEDKKDLFADWKGDQCPRHVCLSTKDKWVATLIWQGRVTFEALVSLVYSILAPAYISTYSMLHIIGILGHTDNCASIIKRIYLNFPLAWNHHLDFHLPRHNPPRSSSIWLSLPSTFNASLVKGSRLNVIVRLDADTCKLSEKVQG